MDLDGVYASVTFPSMVWGFCGQKIWGLKDPELALACVRAYNDWVFEDWAGPYPERIIPAAVTYMPDPQLAADEVRRNAARGFKAVHFSENPEKLGLPSIHTTHWEPFFQACEETETVVNLHLGSSSNRPSASSDTPVSVTATAVAGPDHVRGGRLGVLEGRGAVPAHQVRAVRGRHRLGGDAPRAHGARSPHAG